MNLVSFLKIISNQLKLKKLFVLGILGILVVGEIFIFNVIFDPVILIIWVGWFLAIWFYHLKFNFSVIVGLFFLTLCPVLLVLDKSIFAEKAGNWAFIFLITGVVQNFISFGLKKR